MKNLSLIAAIGPNNELGYQNNLLWHIKEDLAFYKKITLEKKNIIMGRVTYDTLPKVALKGRNPIILSKAFSKENRTYQYFNNLEDVLNLISTTQEDYIVIGGETIYKAFLPYVDTMYLKEIVDIIPKLADTYFPDFDKTKFSEELIKSGIDKTASYKIKKYTRKK